MDVMCSAIHVDIERPNLIKFRCKGKDEDCRGVGRGGAKGAAAPPLTKKKKRRERGERKRERKKKEKRGFKRGRKLNQSFQDHVFMGLE